VNTVNNHPPSFANHVLGVELEKAEKLVEEFIYSCSHGLRSPIKSMMGLTHLLKDCQASDETDRAFYIKLLGESVQRMQGIICQFEQFIENSKNAHFIELVDLGVCVNALADSFGEQLKTNGISVSTLINQKGDFYTDKNRLNIILSALFSNAITFCDPLKDKRKIEFFITASSTGCNIQVRDNGIGISQLELTKIFNLFCRSSEKSNGTGIGLYIVKEVVAKMDGTIAVLSAAKEGTTFSLWVPNLLR
jgi:signal transduction histidine kinase